MERLGQPTGEDKVCGPNWRHRCKFKRLDFLGEPVTFNYEGKTNYETNLGAVCTSAVFIILVLYLSWALTMIANQMPHATGSVTQIR